MVLLRLITDGPTDKSSGLLLMDSPTDKNPPDSGRRINPADCGLRTTSFHMDGPTDKSPGPFFDGPPDKSCGLLRLITDGPTDKSSGLLPYG